MGFLKILEMVKYKTRIVGRKISKKIFELKSICPNDIMKISYGETGIYKFFTFGGGDAGLGFDF